MAGGLRVVAFGGGTGLPVLLRGLRQTSGTVVCAVVTVADDGGSSGRLADELGVAPPGDVRNCLVALASRRRLAEVFDYRFEGGLEMRDHSVGNIIIAALADMAGGFCEGVEQAGRFLRIKGSVYPAAAERLTLVTLHADGSVTRGESGVHATGIPIRRVAIEPAGAAAPPAVLREIERAGVVVLSPGSLFTSIIASLLGAGVSDALARFAGRVVYAANIMTQPGETVGLTVSDHLRAIADHIGPVVTDVLVHSQPLPADLLSRYRAEGASQVEVDDDLIERLGIEVRRARLLPDAIEDEVRHDPARLAQAVCAVAAVRKTAADAPSTKQSLVARRGRSDHGGACHRLR
jgi:uncharacterized cofD-like protein